MPDHFCSMLSSSGPTPQRMVEKVYIKALRLSREADQVTGEKNSYYITLEQLERVLKYLDTNACLTGRTHKGSE